MQLAEKQRRADEERAAELAASEQARAAAVAQKAREASEKEATKTRKAAALAEQRGAFLREQRQRCAGRHLCVL
jgi:hypothetical protein